MVMTHQCSGCENVCPISEQYCSDCQYEIELEDWIDAMEHNYDSSDDAPFYYDDQQGNEA